MKVLPTSDSRALSAPDSPTPSPPPFDHLGLQERGLGDVSLLSLATSVIRCCHTDTTILNPGSTRALYLSESGSDARAAGVPSPHPRNAQQITSKVCPKIALAFIPSCSSQDAIRFALPVGAKLRQRYRRNQAGDAHSTPESIRRLSLRPFSGNAYRRRPNKTGEGPRLKRRHRVIRRLRANFRSRLHLSHINVNSLLSNLTSQDAQRQTTRDLGGEDARFNLLCAINTFSQYRLSLFNRRQTQ